MKFICDKSEFIADNLESLKTFIEEREANSVWFTDEDNTRADSIRFRPIFSEPICIPAEVEKLKRSPMPKFTASEDAYADSMDCPEQGYEGTSQLMYVNGTLWPVGQSAVRSILERAGVKWEGWDKLKKFNPQSLSNALNLFLEATKGSACVLVQDEKVRAVNSGRYAICPATFVVEETERWIQDERPHAHFEKGYVNHDFTVWRINLRAYTGEVLGSFPSLISSGFTPAVQICLSHTGTSSVSLKPCLMLNGLIFPLSQSIDCPHIAKGTSSERTAQMKSSVRENFNKIFPSLNEAMVNIEKLDSIKLSNAYNALLRAMKSLGIPKVQGMEAAEQFHQIYPDTATAYDCFLAIVDAYNYVSRDFAKDFRKQFDVADSVGRAANLKWSDLDIPGDFSW